MTRAARSAEVPRLALAAAACGAAVTACGIWAFWPLAPVRIPVPALDAAVAPATSPPAALDLPAFRAPLWVAQPALPPPPAPARPPPPIRLQLVAIIQEEGQYRAALYDPDRDTLLVVGAGDRVGGGLVESVTAGRVTLQDQAGPRTLVLKDKEP